MEKTIQKTSKLSHDGRNLMTRIPKAIEEEAELKKGDALMWTASGKELGVKNLGSHEKFMKKVAEARRIENRTKDTLTVKKGGK